MGEARPETELTDSPEEKPDLQIESNVSKSINKSGGKAGKKNKEKLGSSRGVETMFRNTSRANYQLMAFADNKASIMITINAFILSILMASISSAINQTPWLMLPFSAFMLTSVVSIFYAVLAAYPRVNDKKVSIQDVRDMKGNANIHFFGTVANMDAYDYSLATEEMIRDQNFLYNSMALDNHNIAKMLLRKFKMLSLAYKAFLIGLAISLISAVGSYIVNA